MATERERETARPPPAHHHGCTGRQIESQSPRTWMPSSSLGNENERDSGTSSMMGGEYRRAGNGAAAGIRMQVNQLPEFVSTWRRVKRLIRPIYHDGHRWTGCGVFSSSRACGEGKKVRKKNEALRSAEFSTVNKTSDFLCADTHFTRDTEVRPMLGAERGSTEREKATDQSAPHSPESSNLKSARQRCYKARDAYYACADASETNKDPSSACRAQRAAFEASCAKSWVQHFDQLRAREARVYCRVQDGIVASEKREGTVGGLQGRREDA